MSRSLIVCAMVGLVTWAGIGCQATPSKSDRQLGGPASTSTPAPSTSTPAESTTSSSPPSDAPRTSTAADGSASRSRSSQFQVQTLDFGTSEAYRVLQQNFEGFLERKPTGFSIATLHSLGDRLALLAERATEFPERFERMSPLEVLGLTLPFVIVALFVFAFFAANRQVGRLSHHLQAQVYLPVSRRVTRLVRGIVLVMGRVVAIVLLLVASYFPVQAVFDSALWTRMLSTTLWVMLAYRLTTSLSTVLISGRLLELTDDHGPRLERSALVAARVLFAFILVLELLETARVSSTYYNLVQFFLRATLILAPLQCYAIRDAVLSLLPRSLESRSYDVYRTFIERNFKVLMVGTAILMAFRAAGFMRASNFILVRGYAVLGVVLGLFLLDSGVRRLLRRRVDFLAPDEERDTVLEETDRSQLSRRVQQLITVGVGVGIVLVALDLLLLLDPTLIVLRTPFLAIGQARISFLSIVNLGLIIFGTVLAVKILRAIMNSKIYPLLEVDVGIAYAINTMLKYLVGVVAFFLAISALGVDLTAVTVVLASLGVGIGFGLQTLVENLISGFIILFGRSVQKGDYITVEGTYGQVDAVGARSVVIKTPDNYEMLIPSKEIVGGRIINWSYEDNSVRARLSVGVSYGSDPREVEDVLIDVCDRHDHVLETPPPRVRLTEFGDSSINFELLFFFDCRETTEKKVVGELNFNVWDALQEADIEIPFPQRDLHIKPEEAPERPEGTRGRES